VRYTHISWKCYAFPDKPVISVGDFNFDFTDENCGFSVLMHWMSDCNISAVPLAADSPTPYTYFNVSLLCSFHIDHILVSKTSENLVSPARTQNSGANLSDHLPLSVRLTLPTYMQGDNCNNPVPNRDVPRMRWDKTDTASHRYTTFCNLASLVNYDCLDSCGKDCQCGRLHVIDEFYSSVVQALQRYDATEENLAFNIIL